MSKSVAAFLSKSARGRAWKRLGSEIGVYENDVNIRSKLNPTDRSELLKDVLHEAHAAHREGDIDRGWKYLLLAQRLELLTFDKSLLNAKATAMRSEADKLNSWRKQAVTTLLTVKHGEDHDRANVFEAATLRDQHYHNEAYKDGLRRGNALRLAIVLVFAVLAVIWLASSQILIGFTDDDGNRAFRVLLSVALFGVLGATISAVTESPKAQSARIPEMTSTNRVTILRLLMGAASAIIVYFALNTKPFAAVFSIASPSDEKIVLVIAFAAGFASERFVLRIVETIAGNRTRET